MLTATTNVEALDETISRLDDTLQALTQRLTSLDEAIRLQLTVMKTELGDLRQRIDARATQESVDQIGRLLADKASRHVVHETRDEVRSLSGKVDTVIDLLTKRDNG